MSFVKFGNIKSTQTTGKNSNQPPALAEKYAAALMTTSGDST